MNQYYERLGQDHWIRITQRTFEIFLSLAIRDKRHTVFYIKTPNGINVYLTVKSK